MNYYSCLQKEQNTVICKAQCNPIISLIGVLTATFLNRFDAKHLWQKFAEELNIFTVAKQCVYVSSFSNFLLKSEAEIRQKNLFFREN